jgi:hypothetical protein
MPKPRVPNQRDDDGAVVYETVKSLSLTVNPLGPRVLNIKCPKKWNIFCHAYAMRTDTSSSTTNTMGVESGMRISLPNLRK